MSKYDPLFKWLNTQRGNRVPATFEQVERILGFDLPASSRTYPQWWENDAKRGVQAKAWLSAGFRTEDVNINNETLAFVRA